MKTTNDKAYFDSLAIVLKLSGEVGSVAISEVHLFAYLACLLSLYRQRPVSGWEYDFIVNQVSQPYSADVQTCMQRHLMTGSVVLVDGYYEITEPGREEYDMLRELQMYQDRMQFIDGACSSVLALPISTIRKAIVHDPEIKSAAKITQTRKLLEEAGVQKFYEQFSELSEAIDVNVDDLMLPAVVWISFLSEMNKR